MLFDTHLHLDLINDCKSVIDEIEKNKIYAIAVTNLPELFFNTNNLCKGSKYLRAALGYHPELAFKFSTQLPRFFELIDETRYIGEVGLDYQKKSEADFKNQLKIFENIVGICAEKKNKILTVHSRKAERAVANILGKDFPGKIILHWFSGSMEEMKKAVDNGYYFSVNLPMTKSINGKKLIRGIPLDRLLLETDLPFANSMGKIRIGDLLTETVKNISSIVSIDKNETIETMSTNFRKLIAVN